jgi:hypothetical protein
MTRSLGSILVGAGTVAAAALVSVFVFWAQPGSAPAATGERQFSTDGPFGYSVHYLGLTCGYMTLESRLDEYEGRPAYHVIMTARNSKFFNKIYRVDGRIESWVDAETMTTVAYISDITERGRRKIRRYRIDLETGTVTAERRGKIRKLHYEGGPALDPLAFVYRGRELADPGVDRFLLNLLTDKGVVEVGSVVGGKKKFNTYDGKRYLLKVQPLTADGEMFSRKGEFIYWIDPGAARTLFRLDFKLGFGRLLAKLEGPADGPADRRTEAELAAPVPTTTQN